MKQTQAMLIACGLTLALISPLKAQDWQKEWSDTLNRAKGQELNLAVHSYEAHEAVAREFQKKNPDIKVNVTPATPSTIAPKIVAEQKNGIYNWDSWWASTANMNNIVMPIDGFAKLTDYLILPEVKDAAQWRRPDMMYTSDRGPYIFVHSYYYEATGFYNTGVVKGLKLDKAEALLDPRLKGKIIIEDPARPNGGSNAIAALLKAQGPYFVRRLLGDMQPSFMSITRQITDSVARGDAAIIIGGNPEAITQCWHAGGCKDVIRLPHINYILARGVGVLKNAPHKEATKIWINWLLSKEGQETYVREWARTNESGAVSMRKDVAPAPKHEESVPDYNRLDQFVSVATDQGQSFMSDVYKLYSEVKNR
jgi:iron(III) transport system substrate-binding protein